MRAVTSISSQVDVVYIAVEWSVWMGWSLLEIMQAIEITKPLGKPKKNNIEEKAESKTNGKIRVFPK